MDTTTQYKYITLMGSRLEGFRMAGKSLWNFRCPICGDSKSNRNKRRGYIYWNPKAGEYRFHCHNCGKDLAFRKFLELKAYDLYQEAVRETLNAKLLGQQQEEAKTAKAFAKQSKVFTPRKPQLLRNIEELPNDHNVRHYLFGRRVPVDAYHRLRWTDDFPQLVEELVGPKYRGRDLPKSGLIYVLREWEDAEHPVVGYQLRSIDKNAPKSHRFVTCKTDFAQTAIFGLDEYDPTKPTFVTEGPMDSLFLPNCLAVLNASLWRVPVDGAIYVNDCEPRNVQVTKQIQKCINQGRRVCMLPEDKYNGLDINDIVKQYQLDQAQLVQLIEEHTYSGLQAKVKFAEWRK